MRGIRVILIIGQIFSDSIPIGADTKLVSIMTRIFIINTIAARGKVGIKDSMAFVLLESFLVMMSVLLEPPLVMTSVVGPLLHPMSVVGPPLRQTFAVGPLLHPTSVVGPPLLLTSVVGPLLRLMFAVGLLLRLTSVVEPLLVKAAKPLPMVKA